MEISSKPNPGTILSVAVWDHVGEIDSAALEEVRGLAREAQSCARKLWPDIFAGGEDDVRFDRLAGQPPLAYDLQVLAKEDAEADRATSGHMIQEIPTLSFATDALGSSRLHFIGQRASLFAGYRVDLKIDPEPADARALADLTLAPPSARGDLDMLRGFLAEGTPRRSRRFEYDFLTQILGASRVKSSSQVEPDAWESASRVASQNASDATWLERLRQVYDYADGHAIYYGEKWRSALVARSMLLVFSTIVTGALGIALPSLTLITIPIQVLVTGLSFWDRRQSARGRWQRKWLEYRAVAERLRCLRFLRLSGVPLRAVIGSGHYSWVEWYALRIERELGAAGEIDPEALVTHLVKAEMAGQISYHRRALRRFAALDGRMRALSRSILISAIVAGAGLSVVGVIQAGVSGVPWPMLTTLGLTIAPTVVAGLNGFRIEFDLVRQAERSARTATGLLALMRPLKATSPSALLARSACARAAALMMDDVSNWRSAAEARTSRLKRR